MRSLCVEGWDVFTCPKGGESTDKQSDLGGIVHGSKNVWRRSVLNFTSIDGYLELAGMTVMEIRV